MKLKKISIILLSFVLILITSFSVFASPAPSAPVHTTPLKVYSLDVGQADCTLVQIKK